MSKTAKIKIPAYLKEIYGWLYLKPTRYKLLDNKYLLNILTLGYYSRLIEELKKEIASHSHILQIGLTLGNQIEETYYSLGALGSYTVTDILPILLEYARDKHSERRITFEEGDATKAIKGDYDVVICYMLLHELPPATREQVLGNIINFLKPGAKAVFIDYHLPLSYNPFKYFVRAFNRLYQPFAEALWKKSIYELTPNAESCTWSQQTYFCGMYQKVVATKK